MQTFKIKFAMYKPATKHRIYIHYELNYDTSIPCIPSYCKVTVIK